MERYLIADMDTATEILDDAGIDYDFDSGDRLMINEELADEAERLFDENGIDYDVI